MDLLRFATVGSVDDGKSTLIGRLLYDSKSILQDQWDAIERTSNERGEDYVNLALLTDGLRAEREQGITIDVAYRYFATPRRKFIIADTPGHVQYTRNMVTGASTADVALILIDARLGVLEQSRRHAFISSLLGIPRLVVCVNKMDLVDYAESAFTAVCEEFAEFASRLEMKDVTYIPISALLGDNVVDCSERMPWFTGDPLLECLETVEIARDEALGARFPVQYVIRPMRGEFHDYRGYAGTVAGGVFHVGDAVTVLPGGRQTRISHIDTYDGSLEAAGPPMSVTLRLEDDLDISRGNLISAAANPPESAQDVEAWVCWMAEGARLVPGARYAIKHTTHSARAVIREVCSRLEINTLAEDIDADGLTLNEIGRVTFRATEPLFFDPYHNDRQTGSFILIDETTNATVGAGMLLGAVPPHDLHAARLMTSQPSEAAGEPIEAGIVPALPAWLARLLPGSLVRPTAITAHTLRLLVGGILVLYLFIVALRLLAASAGGVASVLKGIDAHGPLNLLGFGWLLAYGALSGSPVAALALSLLHGGAIATTEALGMVSGSRFGASMVVLLVGFIAYLRGTRRPDGIYVGVVALLTTATVYAPATAIGIVLLQRGWLHGVVDHLPLQWESIAALAQPLVGPAARNLPGALLFVLGVGTLLSAFTLFDRLLPNLDPPSARMERLSRRFESPGMMFLFGALITSITMSVSLSVTILVPLTLRGVVRRTAVIPYVMGANITTFIDTLFASFLVPGGGATEVVLVEMVSVTFISLLVLGLAYRPYARGVLATAHAVSSQPKLLAVFLVVMTAVPLGLLLI